MAAQQAHAIVCDHKEDDCNKTPHQRNHAAGFLPAPSDGVKVLRWYNSVFEKGAAASAFLGGTLLSVTTGASEKRLDGVRPAAAAGATLFLILFLLCLGLPLFFEFHGQTIVRVLEMPKYLEPADVEPMAGKAKLNRQSASYHVGLALLSLLIQGLALAGTACVFQVIVPFAKIAGWAGFSVTIAFILCTLVAWIWQGAGWVAELEKDRRTIRGGNQNGRLWGVIRWIVHSCSKAEP
ncbi:hypothetical protein LTR10_003695 [Elasticomyces elasticus]|nr:hypothetical protein LTR10_003695 [Elasticomyces elasticus]KAK4978114.1 hypothetical protein LTR42_002491 [Elasticomyces elasticus]